jgi:hypothetical protein
MQVAVEGLLQNMGFILARLRFSIKESRKTVYKEDM